MDYGSAVQWLTAYSYWYYDCYYLDGCEQSDCRRYLPALRSFLDLTPVDYHLLQTYAIPAVGRSRLRALASGVWNTN